MKKSHIIYIIKILSILAFITLVSIFIIGIRYDICSDHTFEYLNETFDRSENTAEGYKLDLYINIDGNMKSYVSARLYLINATTRTSITYESFISEVDESKSINLVENSVKIIYKLDSTDTSRLCKKTTFDIKCNLLVRENISRNLLDFTVSVDTLALEENYLTDSSVSFSNKTIGWINYISQDSPGITFKSKGKITVHLVPSGLYEMKNTVVPMIFIFSLSLYSLSNRSFELKKKIKLAKWSYIGIFFSLIILKFTTYNFYALMLVFPNLVIGLLQLLFSYQDSERVKIRLFDLFRIKENLKQERWKKICNLFYSILLMISLVGHALFVGLWYQGYIPYWCLYIPIFTFVLATQFE